MRQHFLATVILGVFLSIAFQLSAQVGISADNSAPDNSAVLDVKSTTRGMLVPRMTLANRDAIINPATGLLVYCTDNNIFYTNKGTPTSPSWVAISTQWIQNGNNINYAAGKVGIGTATPAWQLDVAGDINYSGALRKNGTRVNTGVSSVTATLPLSSSGGATPNITISQASATTSGYLSSADWKTFNGKAPGPWTTGSTTTCYTGAAVGIGTNSPYGRLQFSNALTNRKIVLYEVSDDDNQYSGFGINASTLRYQVAATVNSHVFYAGKDTLSSVELMRINGNGAVGIGTSTPSAAAALELNSDSKGFLPPRMSASQILLINAPAAGLMVWCTNCGTQGEMKVYHGSSWTSLTGGISLGAPGAPIIGKATAGNAQAFVSFTAPTSNGGTAITSYTATSSPGGFTGTVNQSGSGTITVSGLTNHTAYTFTVTATNATGTSLPSAASNIVVPPYAVGLSYGGGIIFYVDNTGQHGLVASTADQSGGVPWALDAYTYTFMGGTCTSIGCGSANTTRIITQNGAGPGYAAGFAHSYNGGGYTDWFLPSKDELFQLYLQRNVIGGFWGDFYWSSSEDEAHLAETVFFTNGLRGGNQKNWTLRIRAVRAF